MTSLTKFKGFYIYYIQSIGKKVVIFKPLDPFETPEAINRLCDEYNDAINKYVLLGYKNMHN